MGSPSFIFTELSDSEWAAVRAYAIQIMTGGQISSLSGGAKSASFQAMDTAQFLIEYKAEARRRAGTVPPQKVVQNLTGISADNINIP